MHAQVITEKRYYRLTMFGASMQSTVEAGPPLASATRTNPANDSDKPVEKHVKS